MTADAKVVPIHAGTTIAAQTAEPHQGLIEALERLLVMAKSGALRGIVYGTVDIGGAVGTGAYGDSGNFMLLGAFSMARYDLERATGEREPT